MATLNSEVERTVAELERQGWRCRACNHGYMAYPPNGAQAIRFGSTSRMDARTWRNSMAKLRAAGANI